MGRCVRKLSKPHVKLMEDLRAHVVERNAAE